jgi:menaquinone-dependent protoporphyrinogen oxidase
MRTLILYATKHGAASEIARRIASLMDGATVHDLKHGGVPPLDGFDCVVVGGSLYAGMVRKEAKEFVLHNAADLRGKKLGLFISGMGGENQEKNFSANYPEETLKTAKAAYFLGGIYDPKKAGFMERFIMKAVAKLSEYTDTIDDKKIAEFVEVLGS